MKFAIVVFPGSNCDHDAYHATTAVIGQQAELIWHKDTDLKGADAVILPGGFAHGDYLRTGAIARFSPIMADVRRFADAGGPVLGICNGFQVLLEAGLLPGAMLRNDRLHFRCEFVSLRVEHSDTPFTAACHAGQVLRMPIAHGEGNYYAEPECVQRLGDSRALGIEDGRLEGHKHTHAHRLVLLEGQPAAPAAAPNTRSKMWSTWRSCSLRSNAVPISAGVSTRVTSASASSSALKSRAS